MQRVFAVKDLVKYICGYLIEADTLCLVSCNRYLRNNIFSRLELIRLVYISLIWEHDGKAKILREVLQRKFKTFLCPKKVKNCVLYHKSWRFHFAAPSEIVALCRYCGCHLTHCQYFNHHLKVCAVYNAIAKYLQNPRGYNWMCRICGTDEHCPRFFNMNTPLRHWKLPCRKCGEETRVISRKAGDGCFKCGICCVKCSEFRKSPGTLTNSKQKHKIYLIGL